MAQWTGGQLCIKPVKRPIETVELRPAELLGRDARAPQYLAGDAVRTLLDDARRAELPRARQLMSLYVLESWLRASAS